jgi:uncharacterized protein YbjT (DUF2867 family)
MGRTDLQAVLIGATGLVGTQLLGQLLEGGRFASVVVLGRRSVGRAHPKLREHVIDFDAPSTWAQHVVGDVLFSALGTTLEAAGSQAAQYKVDHTYQYETAAAAARNGVPTLVLVSSANASPTSRIFYSRMKGELERDVSALGFRRVHLLRPGPLAGDRKEKRRGEEWGLRVLGPLSPLLPAPLRPIPAATVARAAVRVALDETLDEALDHAPGVQRHEAADLFRLGGS